MRCTSLVHVVFNTFFALLMHEDQGLCFEYVAGLLDEGRVFVVESFVLDLIFPGTTRYDTVLVSPGLRS